MRLITAGNKTEGEGGLCIDLFWQVMRLKVKQLTLFPNLNSGLLHVQILINHSFSFYHAMQISERVFCCFGQMVQTFVQMKRCTEYWWVAFSWLARCLDNVRPFIPCLHFSKYSEVEISLRTLIPLFMPGSVQAAWQAETTEHWHVHDLCIFISIHDCTILSTYAADLCPNFIFDLGYRGDLTSWTLLRLVHDGYNRTEKERQWLTTNTGKAMSM